MKHGKIIGVIYLASKSLVDFAVRSASHVPIYSDPSQFNTPTFHSATPALECHPALPQAHLIPSHLVFAEPPTARLPTSTSTLRNTCGVRGQASVFFSVLQEKDWGSRGGWPEAVDPMHRGLAQEGQSLNRSPPQLWKWGKMQNKGKSPGWVGAFLQVESSGLSSYTVGGTRWPAAPPHPLPLPIRHAEWNTAAAWCAARDSPDLTWKAAVGIWFYNRTAHTQDCLVRTFPQNLTSLTIPTKTAICPYRSPQEATGVKKQDFHLGNFILNKYMKQNTLKTLRHYMNFFLRPNLGNSVAAYLSWRVSVQDKSTNQVEELGKMPSNRGFPLKMWSAWVFCV